MDWSNVTADELWRSLQEVDWVSPRPLWEFATNISIPKNQTKWTSRLKCNAYYYRANYLGMLLVCALLTLFRQPLALLGVALLVAAAMTLNDPAVTAANELVVKGVRRLHPHTASMLRSACGTAGSNLGTTTSRKGRSGLRVVGLPRYAALALVAAAGLYLYLWRGGRMVPLLVWLLLGLGLPLLHATVRSPNLKARLASDREEFRAVWRGYQADMSAPAARYNYSL